MGRAPCRPSICQLRCLVPPLEPLRRLADDPDRSKRTDCCASRMLAFQPDFAEQECAVVELLKERGRRCEFLAKLLCECNPIERLWGWCKRVVRQKCDSTFSSLRGNVVSTLDGARVGIIRSFYRKAWRFMEAYHRGLQGKFAAFVMSQCSK